jgi:putative membrane protein
MDRALVWLHVSGNLLWIGSILAVAVVILGSSANPKIGGELALTVYRRLATPAFLLSFVCGATRLVMNWQLFLKLTHWMHAKLPLALAVIALHHVIGARARKMAQGTVQDPGPTGILAAVLAISAVLAAFFAVYRIPA